MSDQIDLRSNFPIENPATVSTRIFFAKENLGSRIWHLCDAALGAESHGRIIFCALHGTYIYPAIRCDTVLQAKLWTDIGDLFCQQCLKEYELAREVIEERKLLKFK